MTPSFRRGTLEDARAVWNVITVTSAELDRRMGTPDSQNWWLDPVEVERVWEHRNSLLLYMARAPDQFWVAEQDGQIVGYARSSLHDGLRELLDYYVLPAHQGAGVGRELLARAFPAAGARRRVVIASTDIRALARYLKAGVYPRFPIYRLFRKPERVPINTDLTRKPAPAALDSLAALRSIDSAILGFTRDGDHEFLLNDRPAYLYYRGEQLAGYAYFGKGTGPIALLDDADFPAALAGLESEAKARGEEEISLDVPLINRAAVDYLLGRGFRLDPFTVLFMSDEAFGQFDHYIITAPPYFM